MDLFTWTQLSTEHLSPDLISHDDVASLWIPDSQQSAWQWSDNCPPNYVGQHQTIPFTESTISSPESSRSSESFRASSFDGSHFDGLPRVSVLDYDTSSGAKVTGRPRCPVNTGRDPNENRIQRRRTQNRNSQRVYRQRRIEERNGFEARATAAEEDSRRLRTQVDELKTEVAELSQQVKELEADNVALRSSTSSMPWKRPPQDQV